MSAELQAVPNPKFSTAPLTTVAEDIVSRRELKVPVDISGTYSHQYNSNGFQSMATFTIAANEEFVSLDRMTITGDFTPSFFSYDPTYEGPRAAQVPLFDGSSQSLIARFRIGNANGLAIEEVINYPSFAAAISKFVDTPMKRDQDLINFATQGTTFGKDDGWNLQFDSPVLLQTHNTIRNGETTRISLRLMHSSFKNRVPMVPLFLFKNGLQFQIQLESPYRAFSYQLSPSIRNDFRVGTNYAIARGAYDTQLTGNANTEFDEHAVAAATNYSYTVDTMKYKLFSIDKFLPTAAPKWRDSLLLAEGTFANLKAKLPKVDRVHQAPNVINTVVNPLDSTRTNGFHVVPVRFEKDGQNVWSGFTIWADFTDYRRMITALDVNVQVDETTADTHQFESIYWNNRIGSSTLTKSYGVVPVGYNAGEGNQEWSLKAILPLYPMTKEQLSFKATASTLQSYNQFNFSITDVQLVMMPEAAFFIPFVLPVGWDGDVEDAVNIDSTIPNRLANPYVIDWFHQELVNKTALVWDYNIKNFEMKIDLIKPSAQVFQKWVSRYQDVSGIPYAYKRIHYNATQVSGSTADTVMNIQLKLNLRSLCGLVVGFQDIQSTVVNNGNTPNVTTLFYPSITSFLRRGLVRAEVVVGGQSFPYYPLKMLPDGSTSVQWGMDHLLSAENFFDASQYGFQSQLNRTNQLVSRNFAGMGNYNLSYAQNLANVSQKGVTEVSTYTYLDSPSFLLAFSFMKDDTNGMFTGIDTTQSSMVQLNLYFDRSATLNTAHLKTDFYVNTWAIADAVYTHQSDACMVRQ
jgi:hypothetical protein